MLCLSVMTVMEVLRGAKNAQEMKSLSELISHFEILTLDEEISDTAVGLLKRYVLRTSISIPDALIAATALVHGLPLSTSNLKHFRDIEHLSVLKPY